MRELVTIEHREGGYWKLLVNNKDWGNIFINTDREPTLLLSPRHRGAVSLSFMNELIEEFKKLSPGLIGKWHTPDEEQVKEGFGKLEGYLRFALDNLDLSINEMAKLNERGFCDVLIDLRNKIGGVYERLPMLVKVHEK